MQERLITIDRAYEREYEFITRSLDKAKIIWAESCLGRRSAINVVTKSEQEIMLCAILEEVLMTSFKWRYYMENIEASAGRIEDRALVFCLLDFDAGAERKFFKEKIFPQSEIHLDAIYNFRMREVKAVWRSYVELINDFYSTYPTRSDKLELIGYTFSINLRQMEKKRIKCFVSEQKDDNILQNIFYYGEKTVKIPRSNKEILDIVKDLFGKYC